MANIKSIVPRYLERFNNFLVQKGARSICYILAFLAINLYFGNLYYQSRTVTIEELSTQTITVDEIRYLKTEKKGTRFWIVADGMEFDIYTSNLRQHNLSVNSFREKVAEGDQLVISYFDISPFSKKLVVVEAYCDTDALLTLDGYNATRTEPRVMAIIFYFLTTCVYSFVMITSEGWFMQWIRKRNSAREKNECAWEEAAKAARRAEREVLSAQANKRASTAKHPKK